ncbi:hypothetical protein JHL18_11810 [Clostridium sp. YIM B02505]|uniref:Pyruvate carboxyltransferase domain-containing protein n=1 Tax=Clostridium yunnanense TaxID=2800325 RepID=A0ABS1EPH4_9CLOT|nr:hypothetical protein [Clostridium yunnanense]MBK1811312.1 hypothetical protein [Clostridium yunnanense]
MKHVRILDCTLRDGAYLVDKYFGESAIQGIINGLVNCQIDIVEIGFLQNEGGGTGYTVFANAKEAMRFIPKERLNTEFTVLADYSRYSTENLEPNNGKSFDSIRVTFFKDEKDKVMPFLRDIIKKGYKLYVQPVDILGYSDREIIELVRMINNMSVFCFSIVDTYGSMDVSDLQRVYNLINGALRKDINLGFHSHNNLQMSFALSQVLVNLSSGERNVIIDTTLSGMGRGAGNTPTELMIQYLSKMGQEKHYNLDMILDTIDRYIETIRKDIFWGYSIPFFIAGIHGGHVNNVNYLLKKKSVSFKDIHHVIKQMPQLERKRYYYEKLEKIYQQCITDNS